MIIGIDFIPGDADVPDTARLKTWAVQKQNLTV